MYFVHEMRGKMSQKCFEAMTDIAKPAEPVNGQDERRIEVLPKSWTKVMRQSHFEFCIVQDLTHSIFL